MACGCAKRREQIKKFVGNVKNKLTGVHNVGSESTAASTASPDQQHQPPVGSDRTEQSSVDTSRERKQRTHRITIG